MYNRVERFNFITKNQAELVVQCWMLVLSFTYNIIPLFFISLFYSMVPYRQQHTHLTKNHKRHLITIGIIYSIFFSHIFKILSFQDRVQHYSTKNVQTGNMIIFFLDKNCLLVTFRSLCLQFKTLDVRFPPSYNVIPQKHNFKILPHAQIFC